MQAAPPLREGDALAGRYRLVRRTGGTAPDRAAAPSGSTTTWRGRDLLLGRPVELLAVAGGAQDVVDAARRAALVDDPRVMRVLDVGTSRAPDAAAPGEDEHPLADAEEPAAGALAADPDATWSYVVTESVPGETLAAMVQRRGPLPASLVRTLVGEAAQALERARALGLHHRRLTPAHLRRVRDGGVGVTGVEVHAAAAEGEHLAEGGEPTGPLPVVDPAVAARADAVALVALAYAGLTGRWPGPLRGEGDEQDAGVPDAPALPLAPRAPVPHGPGDQPVPPADLVADVPADLDLLCAVTLGPHEDGPRTPGELADQLAPWDSPYVDGRPGGGARPVRRPAVPAARRPAGGSDAGPGPAAPAVAPVAAAAGSGAGTSAAATTDVPLVDAPTAAAAPVPPPADATAPVRGGSRPAPRPGAFETPAAGVAAVASSADRSPGSPDDDDPRDPDGPEGPEGPDGGGRRRAGRGQTVAVVAVVAVGVVVALVWAVDVLTGIGDDDAVSSPQPTATEGTGGGEPSPAPSATATDPAAVPEVVGATDLDPEGDGEEGSDTVEDALDGDEGTAWRTSTYGSTAFGNLKDGVGYALDLGAPTPVQAVTLTTRGSGGTVEVRTADAPEVEGSTVVATADLGGTVEVPLPEGTTAEQLVLWFTELPTVDGDARLELVEVQVR